MEVYMGSNADKLREYFRRQYEMHEGTVEENVDMLFDENVVYYFEGGKTVGLEAVLNTARRVREAGGFGIPFEVTEDGDEVYFRLHLRVPDPKTGELRSEHVQHVWRFGPNGKVVEARPRPSSVVERTVTEGGIEPKSPAA
jgi:hypothetical protein